jgi:hypothetical protein
MVNKKNSGMRLDPLPLNNNHKPSLHHQHTMEQPSIKNKLKIKINSTSVDKSPAIVKLNTAVTVGVKSLARSSKRRNFTRMRSPLSSTINSNATPTPTLTSKL